MCMERKIIQVEERPPLALNIPTAFVCHVRLNGARSVFV